MGLSSKQPFLLTMLRARRLCQSISRSLGPPSLLFLPMQQRWITVGIACIASLARSARLAKAARARAARIANIFFIFILNSSYFHNSDVKMDTLCSNPPTFCHPIVFIIARHSGKINHFSFFLQISTNSPIHSNAFCRF